MKPLEGIKVVSLAVNLPGPAAARSLYRLGACVLKVEPPAGDPMLGFNAEWYQELNQGQELLVLDLKTANGRRRLLDELETGDLLLTAHRPAALKRLGLGWDELHARFPRLCQVAIVGSPPPDENEPGHDLTYQAKLGLLSPPQMPRTLLADMAGAESAVSAALAVLLARERGQAAACSLVALSEAAEHIAEPLRKGVTRPEAILGGGVAEYNIYQAQTGWVAVAALEPHFKQRMEQALGVRLANPEQLRPFFAAKTADAWEEWGKEYDLPIVAIAGDC